MRSIYGYGKVESGKLTLSNQQIFREELKGLSGDVVVEVKEGKGKRSNQQNKFLWGVVYGLISEHTGHTPEELHEFFKDKFLSNRKHIIIGNEDREIELGTTTKLTTKGFEEFVENIRRFASVELETIIPEPNE
jgi:hypothetical protein